MQDSVSVRWTLMAGVAGALVLGTGAFILADAAWMAWVGLVWASLVVSGVVWLATRSNPSVAQTIAGFELDPAPARSSRGAQGQAAPARLR